MTIILDQCIEFLAAYGASKAAVAKILGIHYSDFWHMCEAMPHVVWRPRGSTIGDIQARRKQRILAYGLQAVRLESKHVMAFGERGTIMDLTARFGVVSYKTVLRRTKAGMSLEEALTKPPRGKHR